MAQTAAGSTPPGPTWFDRLSAWPAVHAVVESVQSWWGHHPMRPVAHVALEASNAVARPLAHRHPLTLMLAAAAAGAALAWFRPWRWIFRSALFAGLVPQLASRVVATLPLESWMSMVASALSRQPDAAAGRRADASA
ncbi:MAG: hypothetical protein ABIQ32_12950 [Sphingomicrobium sp.]